MLKVIRPEAGEEPERFFDKLPDNAFKLGVIRPEAGEEPERFVDLKQENA